MKRGIFKIVLHFDFWLSCQQEVGVQIKENSLNKCCVL